MNARTPIPTGFPLWMLTAETALFRVESEAEQRSPNRVIGVPQSGLLATNQSELKGA